MSKSRLKPIYIIVTATAFLLAVFCVVFLTAFSSPIALADESLAFTISTEDGNSWTLWQNTNKIEEFVGEFFNPTTENVASVVFKRAIDGALENAGVEKYSLSFDLPEIGYSQSGSAVFAYTETASPLVIKGVYSPVISSNVTETLEYKSQDSNYKTYMLASKYGDGLTFGQLVEVGSYQVRFVVREIFTFDSVNYSVPRYSVSTACRITEAVPQAPDVEQIEVEYGTVARDIAVALPSVDCTWSLSEEQVNLSDANVRLHVREQAYTVLFDYTPKNSNYQTITGIPIKVKIVAKPLRIMIADAYSLLGEDMAAFNTYEITTPLVEGDSESDLGVTLACENFDKNVAGAYIITARFANADYEPYCVNYTSNFISGGRYMVYATRVSAVAPDGKEFYILLGEGFRNVAVRVELYTDENSANGLRIVCGYEFFFETPSGERVYPTDGFALEWANDIIVAKYVGFVFKDGDMSDVTTLSTSGIIAPQGTKAILFFDEAQAQTSDAREIACIVLASLCGAFGAVLIVLVALYLARRRTLL